MDGLNLPSDLFLVDKVWLQGGRMHCAVDGGSWDGVSSLVCQLV